MYYRYTFWSANYKHRSLVIDCTSTSNFSCTMCTFNAEYYLHTLSILSMKFLFQTRTSFSIDVNVHRWIVLMKSSYHLHIFLFDEQCFAIKYAVIAISYKHVSNRIHMYPNLISEFRAECGIAGRSYTKLAEWLKLANRWKVEPRWQRVTYERRAAPLECDSYCVIHFDTWQNNTFDNI